MKIYLDTSALFKLYHKEAGTEIILELFSAHNITAIFLSEIAKIEFASTVWKKVRMREISDVQAEMKWQNFEADFNKYTFIPITVDLTTQAREVVTKYGKHGLRTLDSIQLATSILLKDQSSLFLTTDKLLHSLFEMENLPSIVLEERP